MTRPTRDGMSCSGHKISRSTVAGASAATAARVAVSDTTFQSRMSRCDGKVQTRQILAGKQNKVDDARVAVSTLQAPVDAHPSDLYLLAISGKQDNSFLVVGLSVKLMIIWYATFSNVEPVKNKDCLSAQSSTHYSRYTNLARVFRAIPCLTPQLSLGRVLNDQP